MPSKIPGQETSGLRVLGRIRLSRDADEAGTSIERQREAIEQWSGMHGHEVIGWAIDIVSGSVDPFDTPELGPWLKEPKLREWDALCAYRLDRLSRRVIPLNQLFGLIQEHGKTLASVSESLDLSTWIGRLVANVIAGVAEGELEAIRERNLGSQKKIRELGRWHGGFTPFGYRSEKRSDGHYLVVDEAQSTVLRDEILPRVLAYESTNSIAEALNEAEVPTPRNGVKWSGDVVRTILRSRTLLGQHEHNGKLVTDDDGLPIQRAKPILSADEFKRVQEALTSRTVRAGDRNRNPLAGVLFCYFCDSPVYLQKMTGRRYSYYRCSKRKPMCQAGAIREDLALEYVEELFLREVGDVERRERVYVAGSDHSEALEAVETALRVARKEFDLGLYEGTEDEYLARLERLTAKRRELESLPSNPAGFEWRGTGETYAQAWKGMEPPERRTMLRDSGMRITMARGIGNTFFSHIYIPDDIRGRIENSNRKGAWLRVPVTADSAANPTT
jgi:site-specific DNA recombinase